MRTALALARASHPAPTVVVTLLAALLAVGAGHRPGGVALVGLAVLAGQLSIGWSNDLLDADRDRAVGRRDKPLVVGELTGRTLRVALLVTVLACAGLSLALGPPAALAHLVLVGAGWAYNLGVKSTAASWLPYVIAFGLLPAVPWLALGHWPPAWMVAVGALLGAGAHLANALPDLADDAATGIRGLPHLLGPRWAGVLAVAVLLAGTAVAVLAPPGRVPGWSWVILAVVVLIAAGGLRRSGRSLFSAAMLIALANVVVLLARG